jgi:Pyridoxamine-phosphate oxidase
MLSKENTNEIFEDIKKNLTRGVKDRKHSFHTPVFSNLDDQKAIQSRVVVLREFDSHNMILNFHTDFRSPKISGLTKNNNSLFVFYDQKLKVQLRIKTTSSINNQNIITEKMWEKTKLVSRKCYLTQIPPSSVTSLPEDGIDVSLKGKEPSLEESEKGYKNFTVVQNKIHQIDWLYLAANGHRRLKIILKDSISSFNWIIP